MKSPKLLLIDLDDTLIALSNSADSCWSKICLQHTSDIVGITDDTLFNAIKSSRDWFWADPDRCKWGRFNFYLANREVVKNAFKMIRVDIPELANMMADTFTSEREKEFYIFPGAITTLEDLKEKGILLALVTNGSSEDQRNKIERFKLARYFDHIQIEEEFGIGKPDKRVYFHVMSKFNIKPEETWMVGDDLECDIIAPKSLGIFTVWINHKRTEAEHSDGYGKIPDIAVNSISDIPSIL